MCQKTIRKSAVPRALTAQARARSTRTSLQAMESYFSRSAVVTPAPAADLKAALAPAPSSTTNAPAEQGRQLDPQALRARRETLTEIVKENKTLPVELQVEIARIGTNAAKCHLLGYEVVAREALLVIADEDRSGVMGKAMAHPSFDAQTQLEMWHSGSARRDHLARLANLAPELAAIINEIGDGVLRRKLLRNTACPLEIVQAVAADASDPEQGTAAKALAGRTMEEVPSGRQEIVDRLLQAGARKVAAGSVPSRLYVPFSALGTPPGWIPSAYQGRLYFNVATGTWTTEGDVGWHALHTAKERAYELTGVKLMEDEEVPAW